VENKDGERKRKQTCRSTGTLRRIDR